MSRTPDFELLMATGDTVRRQFGVDGSVSDLEWHAGYGQAFQLSVTISGTEARTLRDKNVFRTGTVIWKAFAGFRRDLTVIARNLTIGQIGFDSDSRNAKLRVDAFGVSWRLRNSGKRTRVLKATSYAGAIEEVAALHGVTVRIGANAYQPVKEAKKDQTPGTNSVTPTIETSSTVNLPAANQAVIAEALRKAAGDDAGLDHNSRNVPEWCASFVRQVVERALGLENRWELSAEAYRQDVSHENNGKDANDYASAARALGWVVRDLIPGCILYAEGVSLPRGHIAIYVGLVSGVPSVLENTTQNRGIPVFGSGPVRLTPLSSWDTITLVSSPARPVKGTETGQANATGPNVVKGFSSDGVTGVSKSSGVAQGRKPVIQKNEDDWSFLEGLARQIGYVIAETPDGGALYCGPGLEVGNRDRFYLVHGLFSTDGASIPANVESFSTTQTLHGIPTEMLITGWEGRQRFEILVSTDDLAARHKVKLPPAESDEPTSTNSSSSTSTSKPVTTLNAPSRNTSWQGELERLTGGKNDLYYAARTIIFLESSDNPLAVGGLNRNGTRDYGLFQLNSAGQGAGMTEDQMLDFSTNLRVGLEPIRRVVQKYPRLKGLELVLAVLNDGPSGGAGHRSIIINNLDVASAYQVVTKGKSAGSSAPSNVVDGFAPVGVTGVQKSNAAPITSDTLDALGAENFADKPIRGLIDVLDGRRAVLGDATNPRDARERALDALALERLRLVEANVSMPGEPRITVGSEVIVAGSRIPKPDAGLYVVMKSSGSIGSNFLTQLTLNRNQINEEKSS